MIMVVRNAAPSALACGLTVLLAACGSDPLVPSVAVPAGTTSLNATVAASVGTIPIVKITNDKGKSIRNVLVRWRVTTGGGRVANDSVRTDRDGNATSGGWTLGTVAGLQTLQASADGVPAITFTATAAPGPVAQVNRVSTEPVNPVVNTAVSPAPSARVVDQYGNPVPAVAVTFSVITGNGTVSGAQQTTDANGLATAGGWLLGTQSGTQQLRAVATGGFGVTFTVSSQPGAPADLIKIAGDNQQTIAGLPVTNPPGVRIIDAFSNHVGNVPVTFTPGANSGTVTGATQLSDPATGTAFVGNWTLGTPTQQTLVATSTAIPGKSATFVATAVTSAFTIDVRFVGLGGSTAVRAAFLAAAERWRRVVVGISGTSIANVPSGFCGDSTPALAETITNVVIFARITPIDGSGNILGQAGPCATHTASNLPALGLMEFDVADMDQLLARGGLTDVVTHEMGHVLGFGTLWNYRRALLTNSGGTDPFFSGASARAGFTAINTTTYSGNAVPVENTGGGGTRDAHWRESVFGRELLTGFYNVGAVNPLSRVSIGSMQDLGYAVNLAQSDVFTLTAALWAFPFTPGADVIDLGADIPDRPLFELQSNGTPRMMRASIRR